MRVKSINCTDFSKKKTNCTDCGSSLTRSGKTCSTIFFLVDPTTIKHFYFLNQMVLCMARGNLTCNHVTKQARREGFFDKDKTCLNSLLGADF